MNPQSLTVCNSVSSLRICCDDIPGNQICKKVYDIFMKYLFLAFFIFVASLPVQAVSCDMQEPQETSHNQHDDMQHDNMPGMDCCDPVPSTTPDHCDSDTHCGASVTVVAISIYASCAIPGISKHRFLSENNSFSSRFTNPPFRPPIA